MSKCGVFSGPYFPAFGLNMNRYEVSLRIQYECGKIRTRKNSVFGHFSEVFCWKSILKICSKFTCKHPCRSAISIKLQSTSAWVLSCKFAVYFQNTFSKEHPWTAASENNILNLYFMNWLYEERIKGERNKSIIFLVNLFLVEYISLQASFPMFLSFLNPCCLLYS